ncbi:MAG TPA: hypothetical protein VF188_14645 [Longimicrobiales bacterium]
MFSRIPLCRALIALAALAGPAFAQTRSAPAGPFGELRFRSIGPAVTGGRIHDIEALPGDPATLYVATASGGLWKSVNHGTTWTPLFDDQPVSTFGDVAIAPSDPDVIWAGTGEQNNRQSSSWGNGVYRSTDGGRTWTHLGLVETRHIGKVLVHPEDPDRAYVAALGNLWKPGPERGVYRTTDGGRTWERVLFVDTLTGVVDLVMDPTDPNTLYAAAYQRLRRTWGFNGGGPGSGIYKSTDGGESWIELTNGIPAGDKGRIGLAIARTDPDVLIALIQHATEGGTYRSEDGGRTWTRVNELNPRPMYYSEVFIDPTNADRVYVLGTDFYRSEDGGHTFRELPIQATYDVGVHSDLHALWIDPGDPDHFYLGGDGGLYESWDGGENYAKINNLPIAQIYGIDIDNRDPYYIYAGLQDNHSWLGPSATRHWLGILDADWRQIGFGDGMHQEADPTSHRYIYSLAQNGALARVDAETGDRLDIRPAPPAGAPDDRFDWVTPVLVSRHDPRVVYLGGNRLFISRDRGNSWSRTEDLTRRIDRDTLELMGVRGADIALSRNDGESSFGEITDIAESPLDPAILWVGTDDGNVQVSRDGGETWAEVGRNIRPAHTAQGVDGGRASAGDDIRGERGGRDVPARTYVSDVTASAAAPGRAYVALDAHRRGDFRPYVFRTDDFGRSWTPLVNGLPADGSVNVLIEHPDNPDLLFLGTEHALFVSLDAGAHWSRLRAGLPTTLIDDLGIHPRENDLIVATHGRGLWILDDITPLERWSDEVAAAPVHLFPIRPATIFQYWKDTSYRGHAVFAGENPPFGAILNYHLAESAAAAEITITNADGRVVRRLDAPASGGIVHRVVWDLRHEPPPSADRDDDAATMRALPHSLAPRGPFVSPGTYTVALEADGARTTRTVTVRGDPLMPLTLAQAREREAFLLDILAMQRQVWDAMRRADTLRHALTENTGGPGGTKASAARAERTTEADRLRTRLDRLRRQIYGLAREFNGAGAQQGSLYPPTATHRRRKAELEAELQEAVAALAEAERMASRR